jgi:hypothetical protein
MTERGKEKDLIKRDESFLLARAEKHPQKRVLNLAMVISKMEIARRRKSIKTGLPTFVRSMGYSKGKEFSEGKMERLFCASGRGKGRPG